MTRSVEVRTGARLHFGLLSSGQARGRLGGIGMMIDRPGIALTGEIRHAESDKVEGPPEAAERAAAFFRLLRENGRHEMPEPCFRVRIEREIPAHHGFGSGTQLAMALLAVHCLAGSASPEDLGRGKRSVVGTRGFFEGGFIVDAGPLADEIVTERSAEFDIEGEIYREPLPKDRIRRNVPDLWRVVIIDPPDSSGTSGSAESAAFAALPGLPAATTRRLVELLRDRVLPGLTGREFLPFASGVAEFNHLVGDHFAPAQGGVYAHPLIRELAESLADTDWPYLAQSSWGPAAAIFCESEEAARALVQFLAGRIDPGAAEVFIASPKNTGADVVVRDV